MNYRKAFAVAILSGVWAGAILPPSFIAEAEKIRTEMTAGGTWASA